MTAPSIHLASLLRAVTEHNANAGPTPLPEALAMDLAELAARYGEVCPFHPGDLVTPRPGYSGFGAGEPCIVLETFVPPHRVLPNGPSADTWSNRQLARLDMRIARRKQGVLAAFAAESWMYQAWAPAEGKSDGGDGSSPNAGVAKAAPDAGAEPSGDGAARVLERVTERLEALPWAACPPEYQDRLHAWIANATPVAGLLRSILHNDLREALSWLGSDPDGGPRLVSIESLLRFLKAAPLGKARAERGAAS